jgi:hypothetical protein
MTLDYHSRIARDPRVAGGEATIKGVDSRGGSERKFRGVSARNGRVRSPTDHMNSRSPPRAAPEMNYAGLARLTRTFRGVAVTRQPTHESTSSPRKSIATRSRSATLPGCGSRTKRMPW